MRTIIKDPALAATLIAMHKAGRFTTDLLIEAINDPKLARKMVMHETMHDLSNIPGVSVGINLEGN